MHCGHCYSSLRAAAKLTTVELAQPESDISRPELPFRQHIFSQRKVFSLLRVLTASLNNTRTPLAFRAAGKGGKRQRRWGQPCAREAYGGCMKATSMRQNEDWSTHPAVTGCFNPNPMMRTVQPTHLGGTAWPPRLALQAFAAAAAGRVCLLLGASKLQ